MDSHCPSIFKKSHLFLIFLVGISGVLAYSKVLPDPIIGERCEDMANRRKEKYQYKQRIYELLTKNRNLRAQTPPQKEKLLRQLYKVHNDLNQRRHLIEAQILNLEEEIIRKGCPGLPVGDLKEGQALEKIDSSAPTAENLNKSSALDSTNSESISNQDESAKNEDAEPQTQEQTQGQDAPPADKSTENNDSTNSVPSNPVVTPDALPAEISTETEDLLKEEVDSKDSKTTEPEKNDSGTTP